jgi:CRISPR/Cas system endoribonuclease Cas6 (RAMP superfamily)
VSIHDQIKASTMFILYERVGKEVGIYPTAKQCAGAVVVHPHPERMMVRGLAAGREVFRMPAEDFGMTVYD